MAIAFLVTVCVVVIPPLRTYKSATETVGDMPVVIIDGCQYFRNATYVGYSVYTHKGNCTNVFHKAR